MNILSRVFEHILCNILGIRISPRTLQIPITSYCNSRCTTCNVWRMKSHSHIDYERLSTALSDKYFKRVTTVGLNGGEPSLYSGFLSVVEVTLTLPALKDIYIISNGMKKELLLPKMEAAVKLCRQKNVTLHLTISLDGVGEVYNITRGVSNAFSMAWETIKIVAIDTKKYCDNFDVGYTISKNNPTDMMAVKTLLETVDVSPYYHIAVPNKRINTFDDRSYSVLNNSTAMFLAREFFYSEFVSSKDIKSKLKSFINFYYLKNDEHKRIAICNYLRRDVMIDETLRVYLCATASEQVGSLTEHNMSQIVQSGNLDKEVSNVKQYCEHCIHYAFAPTFKGFLLFSGELLAKLNLVVDIVCARLHL